MWNLAMKRNTAKDSFNERPQDIIAYIRETTGGQKAVIVTHSPSLVHELMSHIKREHLNWQVCCYDYDWDYALQPGYLPDRAGIQQLFIVDTHLFAPETKRGKQVTMMMNAARSALASSMSASLNPDHARALKM